MASYRDPELGPTLDDLLKQAQQPDNLHICICFQYSKEDKFNSDIDKYRDDKRFTIIDVDYTKTKGTCWARNKIQQKYKGETYTLQLDSHHRFVKNWDTKVKKMYKKLKKEGYNPLLTAYIPSYNPANDPEERINEPWELVFDRFIPEGAIFFMPQTMQDKEKPQLGRFFSAHFAFTEGEFCTKVPHDPNYYFHGEEISLAVRAYTHGYDLFYPNEVIAWHEYTRVGRTKHWDDDKTWVDKNKSSHSRNRQLLGVDGEVCSPCNEKTFDKYGLGKVRTLEEYEIFAGVRFSDRSVTQRVLDQALPPGSKYDEFLQKFRHCIDQHNDSFTKDDYTFIAVILQDKSGKELYRRDLTEDNIKGYRAAEDGWWKIWVEYNGPIPYKWIIWPHSKEEGWIEYREGIL